MTTCKSCNAALERVRPSGLCAPCYQARRNATATTLRPKQCAACDTEIWPRNKSGLCGKCSAKKRWGAEMPEPPQPIKAERRIRSCSVCYAPITRKALTGMCRTCAYRRMAHVRGGLISSGLRLANKPFKEPAPKVCPIGPYGYSWPRLHGMSDRAIERLMLAAMDRAGVRHG